MTLLLGLIQFIIIGIICIYELKNKSISLFLWAILLIIFGIMHLITCFIGGEIYNNNVLNTASLYVILFCIIYLIIRNILRRKSNIGVINIKKVTNIDNERFYKVLMFLLLFVVILQMVVLITGAGGLFNTSWGNMRKTTVGAKYFSFSQIFTTLFFVTSSVFLVSLVRKKKIGIIFSFLIIIFEVLVSRNRIEILPIFCCILIIYISTIKRLTIKQILSFSLIAIIIIYCVYGLRVFRHYGTLETFFNEFEFSEFNETIGLYIKTDNGELGLKNHFYYFIKNNNNFLNFNKGNTYKRMLLVWLPTKWSGGLKPSDFAISMGYAVDPTIVGYSVHPTLFGDCYANCGFFGFLFMGLFWGIYVSILDLIVNKTKDNYLKYCFISICAVAYIIIGRGSVYNGFVWQFFGMIILYAINIMTRIRYGKMKGINYEKQCNN